MYRPVKKHKRSYVQRPIGAGGKAFRFLHKVRTSAEFGGGAVGDGSPFSWQRLVDQYKTSTIPVLVRPPTLSELVFEQDASGSVSTTFTEAKYPDLFRYRYITPSYYGISVRIIRARSVFDTTTTTGFTPTVTDLAQSELSWQLPITFYWRADYSNMNDAFPFYQGDTNNQEDIQYYNYKWPQTTPPNSENILCQQLINRRFNKCVLRPNQECVMSMSCHFPTHGLAGASVQANDTEIFGNLTLMETYPVTCWLRAFNRKATVPGRSNTNGQGIVPGDMFMLCALPEVTPDYQDLYREPDDSTDPKARLCVEYEVSTTLVLNGSEYLTDTYFWGGRSPGHWPTG